MPRNLNEIVHSWIRLQDFLQIVQYCNWLIGESRQFFVNRASLFTQIPSKGPSSLPFYNALVLSMCLESHLKLTTILTFKDKSEIRSQIWFVAHNLVYKRYEIIPFPPRIKKRVFSDFQESKMWVSEQRPHRIYRITCTCGRRTRKEEQHIFCCRWNKLHLTTIWFIRKANL